jgi:anti-anti-sigma factor
MTAGTGDVSLTIKGARLTASGKVDAGDTGAFRNALTTLIDSGGRQVVVDVRGIESVGSIWIGMIAAAMARARTKGVKVKVIGTPRVTSLLDDAGLSMLGEIRSGEE